MQFGRSRDRAVLLSQRRR